MWGSCYDNRMAKPKKFDLENPAPVVDDEDAETLAAIDGDAEAGWTVPDPCAGSAAPVYLRMYHPAARGLGCND